jgi:hypothetical protein
MDIQSNQKNQSSNQLEVVKNSDRLMKSWVYAVKSLKKRYALEPYLLANEISKIKTSYIDKNNQANRS